MKNHHFFKKTRQILKICAIFAAPAMSLEFGAMGSVAPSMGGAGVAFAGGKYVLYYNPALLALNDMRSFGYSASITARQRNLIKLFSIDPKALASFAKIFESTFGKANGANAQAAAMVQAGMIAGLVPASADPKPAYLMAAASGTNVRLEGAFADFVKKLLGVTGNDITQDDLKKFLVQLLTGQSLANGVNDVNGAVGAIKTALGKKDGTARKLLEDFKKKAQNANNQSGNNPLLGILIQNFDEQNVGNLAELLQNNNSNNGNNALTSNNVLEKLGPLKIDPSTDISGIDTDAISEILKNLSAVTKALKANDFSASSQNGIVINVPRRGVLSGSGMALGAFTSVFLNASSAFDPKHNKIIIGETNSFLEVKAVGEKISLENAANNNESLFNDSAHHKIRATMLSIIELAFGYGKGVNIGYDELSFGGAIRLMHGVAFFTKAEGNLSALKNIKLPKEATHSTNVALDLATAYRIRNVTLGLVAKNVNLPRLKLSDDENITLDSNFRAGVSIKDGDFIYNFDSDLWPNSTLSSSVRKNLMVGGGVFYDMGYMDLRGGMMMDAINLTAPVLTFGANFFGFLDLGLAVSTKWTKLRQFYAPDFLSFQLGGGVSW